MTDDGSNPESLLEFPCCFPIKIMGRDTPGFRDTVVAIIERHAGSIQDDAIRTLSSSKQAYVSVTITISAQSQDQLDNIYQDLTDCEDVMVSL